MHTFVPMLLSEAPIGKKLRIEALRNNPLESRMYHMGLRPGVTLSVVRASFFGGPLAVNLGSSILALRKEEAAWVEVSPAG